MPTQISLVTELSRERLEKLRAEIDALLGPASERSLHTQPASPPGSDGQVEEMARRLRGRAGPDLQKLVKWLVKQYPQGSFVWEDVAAGMNAKLPTVKSWHRSVSKPLNRLAREFPGAPAFMSRLWDGKRNHYTLHPEWVAAIDKTWP